MMINGQVPSVFPARPRSSSGSTRYIIHQYRPSSARVSKCGDKGGHCSYTNETWFTSSRIDVFWISTREYSRVVLQLISALVVKEHAPLGRNCTVDQTPLGTIVLPGVPATDPSQDTTVSQIDKTSQTRHPFLPQPNTICFMQAVVINHMN